MQTATMRYLIDHRDNTDPAINLALEEYCMKHLDPRHDYVLLYQNRPSVVVGRNQNILQEIDGRYVQARNIQVLRRLSGGGAVYHDRGNLNFSFIEKRGAGRLQSRQAVLGPVLRSLRQMGVGASINDRSDLLVGTRKISGSARFSNTRRDLVHGTLLFDADLQALRRALRPPAHRLLTKAIRSVPHPVANIRPLLEPSMDLSDFTDRLLTGLRGQVGEMWNLSLDDQHWQRIHRLAADKYRSWDWTFGRTPEFSVMKNDRRKARLRIDVRRGKIAAIADLAPDDSAGIWCELEKRLAGTRYERKAILQVLDGIRFARSGRILDSGQLAKELLFDESMPDNRREGGIS